MLFKAIFVRTLTAGALMVLAPSVFGQATQGAAIKPYDGEIVMRRDGSLPAPWQTQQACLTKARTDCRPVIINTKTKEIAKAGDRWTTGFEATGNGQEGRRAETTMAKARRLAGAVTPETGKGK